MEKGASQYRTIASFLSKWLECFPTDKTPLSKQKIKTEQQKLWFVGLSSSLSLRISHFCGPEVSSLKKQWERICKLQKQYGQEKDLYRAVDSFIEIAELTEELRDSFIRIHNRLYGSEPRKLEQAMALRALHPDWSNKKVAKEAGFANVQSLYRTEGRSSQHKPYQNLCEVLKEFAKMNANIPRGSKNGKTGDIEAY